MSTSGAWMTAVGAFCIFSAVSLGTYLLIRFAHSVRLLDVPNHRSSHDQPTPRGGGLVVAIVFLGTSAMAGWFGMLDAGESIVICGGGFIIALLGFLDDFRGLSARVRLAVHILVASAALFILVPVDLRTAFTSAYFSLELISIMAIAWSVNLFNFMDGIDGLATSEAIFITSAGAYLNWMQHGRVGLTLCLLCLAIGSLGFLGWNWPKARIFLGDSGSGFLGFEVAALGLAVSETSAIPIQVWLILGGAFLVDSSVTLIRRIAGGEPWTEAHRSHAYQRLARYLGSHLKVTLLFCLINVAWLLPWATFSVSRPKYASLAVCAALVPLVPFVFLGKSLKKSTG